MSCITPGASLHGAVHAGHLHRDPRIDMQRRIRDLLEMPDGSLLTLVDDKQGELLRLTVDAARDIR